MYTIEIIAIILLAIIGLLLWAIFRILITQNLKLNIMAERTEQALADLQAITDKLQKIGNETALTLQKVKELEEAAANADTPQSVLDKIAEVKTQAQVVDDLTPDAEPPVE